MSISRGTGLAVPGWAGVFPGGGISGLIPELDIRVAQAAAILEKTFGMDVEIRFNANRLSGGAYLLGIDQTCGITAKLWDLPSLHSALASCCGNLNIPDSQFSAFCREQRIDPNGPEQQITIHAFIDADLLIDCNTATEGAGTAKYAYPQANSVEDAVDIIENTTILRLLIA